MGSFRRRIVIVHRPGEDAGEARACLEDDFHHFRVRVVHGAGRVRLVRAESVRNPYTLCPAAGDQLRLLEGMALSPVASSVGRATDASEQCTHQFDLAGLAIAAAAGGCAYRRYDIEVADRIDERTRASLQCDGHPLLDWDIEGSIVNGPSRFAGLSLREGFARWVHTRLPAEEAQAAMVLRRCALISLGRGKALDLQLHANATGLCFAQQPVRAMQALRVVGSTWDFSAPAKRESLCAGDAAWLAFDDAPEGR
ncbi:MAG: DUF2889 domain-containing protein [Aquincola sp.]|nr:DUF2889 domain-containing protein [Aquincola sp.]|tara:strand:- start:10067 stop:10828 length:762 start_codon:yes stop_codon:yes gene_type:complete